MSHDIIQSDQGGGEAPAPVLEVNPLHLVSQYVYIINNNRFVIETISIDTY